MQKIKKVLLSEMLSDCTKTQRIAYIAVMTALCVVCNMFFEFKFADTQFSMTIFFSALTGMLIGPIYGFVACFLGDLVGFLYNSGGFTYLPWIGLSMGIVALISGLVMNCFEFKSKLAVFIKLGIVCILTFLLCTVAINTTAFWLIYNTRKVPYMAYLTTRLFVQGQIWNSLFNYVLLFVAYPVIIKIKELIKPKKNIYQNGDNLSNFITEKTEQDIFNIYEQLKNKYDLVLTTTSKLDEGFTIDCPIIVGKAHEKIIELYECDGMFVMDVKDVEKTKGTHWHPYEINDAIKDIVEFMDGKSDYKMYPFKTI